MCNQFYVLHVFKGHEHPAMLREQTVYAKIQIQAYLRMD